jgi:hypothetical protein
VGEVGAVRARDSVCVWHAHTHMHTPRPRGHAGVAALSDLAGVDGAAASPPVRRQRASERRRRRALGACSQALLHEVTGAGCVRVVLLPHGCRRLGSCLRSSSGGARCVRVRLLSHAPPAPAAGCQPPA